MNRTTQKALKEHALYRNVTDITNYDFDAVCELREKENGFSIISVSIGKYGQNGALLQGYNSKKSYVITARNSTLAQLV